MDSKLKKRIIILGEAIYDAIYLFRKEIPGVHRFIDENLMGACAIASFFLHHKLKSEGISSSFIEGFYGIDDSPHCWLTIENSIIDITATQFNYFDKVIILGSGKKGNYIPKSTGRIAFQWVKGWEKQSPFLYGIEWVGDSARIYPLLQEEGLTSAA